MDTPGSIKLLKNEQNQKRLFFFGSASLIKGSLFMAKEEKCLFDELFRDEFDPNLILEALKKSTQVEWSLKLGDDLPEFIKVKVNQRLDEPIDDLITSISAIILDTTKDAHGQQEKNKADLLKAKSIFGKQTMFIMASFATRMLMEENIRFPNVSTFIYKFIKEI